MERDLFAKILCLAFSGRGKSRPLKLLQKCEDVQKAFASLKADEISDENIQLLEGFACKMYPNSKCSTSVNESRLKHFYMAYKRQKSKAILSVKNVSSISMPSCYNALYQKILRVHLITAMWLNAYRSDPPCHVPIKLWLPYS